MKNANITVTMNEETHSGQGKMRLTNGVAEISYTFFGETELSFSYAGGTLNRKGEISFSLPLGKCAPRPVELITALGTVPATVKTARYSARVSDTFAHLTVTYLLSDGYEEQEFSFALSAFLTEEV